MSELNPLNLLTKDIKAAARLLSPVEARYLVDAYYTIQDDRIRSMAQVRAMRENEEPSDVLTWLADNTGVLEKNIQRALDAYTLSQRPGRWMRSITGLGPVITAGMLAHINIEKAPTVGHIWRFAGLDPTTKWEKGQKRPYNAKLKVLCWKLGESFKKVSGNEKDIYGRVYRERKALEVQRNEVGLFANQAAESLATRKIQDKDLKATLESGKLPAGRLDLRASRYAVKLFLSHLHHVMHVCHFGIDPPKPYVITHLQHAHYLAPPNWPID